MDVSVQIPYIERVNAVNQIASREGAHDPRAIANFILGLRKAQGRPTTIMQLIKLVYLSDGWSMALLGRPLSKHNAQAWKFGPVYPTVYSAFKMFGSSPVTQPATVRGTDLPIVEEFSADEEQVIRTVVDSYGKLSAYQLSNLTHQAGTPWSEAFEGGAYSEIPIDSMASHFTHLKESRLAQA